MHDKCTVSVGRWIAVANKGDNEKMKRTVQAARVGRLARAIYKYPFNCEPPWIRLPSAIDAFAVAILKGVLFLARRKSPTLNTVDRLSFVSTSIRRKSLCFRLMSLSLIRQEFSSILLCLS